MRLSGFVSVLSLAVPATSKQFVLSRPTWGIGQMTGCAMQKKRYRVAHCDHLPNHVYAMLTFLCKDDDLVWSRLQSFHRKKSASYQVPLFCSSCTMPC